MPGNFNQQSQETSLNDPDTVIHKVIGQAATSETLIKGNNQAKSFGNVDGNDIKLNDQSTEMQEGESQKILNGGENTVRSSQNIEGTVVARKDTQGNIDWTSQADPHGDLVSVE